MGLIIDTNLLIDQGHGREGLSSLGNDLAKEDAYIAAITVSELLAGVHLANDFAIKIKRSSFVESIISTLPVLHFDEVVARAYAEIYAYFIKPRSKLGSTVHDLQIAATALAHGFPIITKNKVDFIKIPGIEVVTV